VDEIAVDVNDLSIAVGHLGEDPMEIGLAGGYRAKAHLGHTEYAAAALWTTPERTRGEAEKASVHSVAAENARLVASGACAVAHFVLQGGVECARVEGDRAGDRTTGRNLVDARVFDYLAGEADICLLAGKVNVRASVEPQFEDESLTYHRCAPVCGCSSGRS
jgi:hypothetical protein